MNTQTPTPNQIPQIKNKSFLYTYKDDPQKEKVEEIMLQITEKPTGVEKIIEAPTVAVTRYDKGNESYYLVDDRLRGLEILVRDDDLHLEKAIDEIFYQIETELNKYFGEFDNMEIWDNEVEFYRTYPEEQLLERFQAVIPIKIRIGDYENHINTVDVRLTQAKSSDKYGVRVYVSLYELMYIIEAYIYNNYTHVNVGE